ncbi:hypothetical protein, partial [Acinetobacter lwoffii]
DLYLKKSHSLNESQYLILSSTFIFAHEKYEAPIKKGMHKFKAFYFISPLIRKNKKILPSN